MNWIALITMTMASDLTENQMVFRSQPWAQWATEAECKHAQSPVCAPSMFVENEWKSNCRLVIPKCVQR